MSNFVFQFATKGTILAVNTAVNGTDWTAFPDSPCSSLDITNNTGTAIEYRRNGGGAPMPILNGMARGIVAITNASQISVRRVDLNVAQVTVQAEALLV